ncbi:MAG: hypothetical protein A2Y41_12550 [Spirochaetes bacterium GWB1_36_13]|nr:MAG: hypothetical protein A2Y41_12550 [Spirochaetes bacterium GWB1_36_13]
MTRIFLFNKIRRTVLFLLFFMLPYLSYSSGWMRATEINGAGISFDLDRELTGEKETLKSVYFTYHYGFFFLLSPFLNLDMGYSFEKESFNSRLGIKFMFLLIGLEGGYISKYEAKRYSPGLYLGVTGFIMDDSRNPLLNLFLSFGINCYFDSRNNELYGSATLLFNFFGD